MNKFQKIVDIEYKKNLEEHFVDNLEFRNLIKILEENNFNLERLNHEKEIFNEYFNSVQMCKNNETNCLQEVSGFRKKIIFLHNNFFMTLTRCIHSQKPELLFREYYVYADFPENIKQKSFRDVKHPGDEDRNKLLNFFNDFIINYDSNVLQKGVYLSGSSGTGKTFLFALLTNKLILKREQEVAFINANKIIWNLKKSWNYTEIADNLYKKLANVPYLVIDNLGLETMTNYYRDEFFMPLLTDRFNHNRSTFFLSIYKMNDLQKHYTFSTSKSELIRVNAFFNLLKKMTTELELKKVITNP